MGVRILITGASGFVGGAILNTAKAHRLDVRATYRNSTAIIGGNVVNGLDVNADSDWAAALRGIDVVIHCAAISEVGKSPNLQQLQALRSVNVDGALNLARQAGSAGVKRFVFLSSIKVNGDLTSPHKSFTPDDIPFPTDAYGFSKLDAEKGLREVSREFGMEFVIIRPPMVYGPNVKGNFRLLMKLVEYGFPLPLSNIRNQRSFIGIDNLVDLVITCIRHPKAANQIFLASDDHDLSTTELLCGIAQAIEKPLRLFSCPPRVLATAAKCVGKTSLEKRILGSLQVDVSRTKHLLGWWPPVDVKEGLSRCFPK